MVPNIASGLVLGTVVIMSIVVYKVRLTSIFFGEALEATQFRIETDKS